jgi:type IV secretion system protein VirB4
MEAVREKMVGMPKGTFLIKRDTGSFIATADLSSLPEDIAVLSGNPRRRALVHRIMAEVGEDPDAWLPEYRRRYKEADL